jgi:predicted transcriptional regulator of viral defense system
MAVIKNTHRPASARTRLLRFARTHPVLRVRDAVDRGVHSETFTRMARAGELERFGPGRYRLAAPATTEHHDLVLATAAVPAAVVCLLSALRFHQIGTQLPHEVWIAVPRGTRVPRLTFPPVRAVRISSPIFDLGIERHRVEGHLLKVYGVARTVADCFRFRNRIGLDVALEALHEAWRSRRLDLNELARIARRLRIQRVMQPYLESVVL